MKAYRGGFLAALTLLFFVAPPGALLAQPSGGPIDIQLFRPAIDSKGLITVNGAQVLGHLDPSFGLILSYTRMPFSVFNNQTSNAWCQNTPFGSCTSASADYIPSNYRVENMVTGYLQGAVGLFDRLQLGIGLPLSFWNGDSDPNPELGPNANTGGIDAQGAGDLAINLKGQILSSAWHPLGLTLINTFSIPTGDDTKFLGTGRFGVHPSLVVDKTFFSDRLYVALNVGGRFRVGSDDRWVDRRQCNVDASTAAQAECGTGVSVASKQDLVYGVGAAYAVVPTIFDLIVEVIGQTGLDGPFERAQQNSAHEVLVGAKLYLASNSYFTLGVGRGLRGGWGGEATRQYGSPDLRAFVGFVFEPLILLARDEPAPLPVEPDLPREEVFSDRDGDGIPDHLDLCPDDPEDFDGFEDEDGCPDPDNDGDGIPDIHDLCPNAPEDFDGFQDEDGCPDFDNDGDGIPDVDDYCPDEPGPPPYGCPLKPPVIVHHGSIEILDKVYFETNSDVIQAISFSLLDAVAQTLQDNPQILRLEVQGHADQRGSVAYNLGLTQRRADSVRRYLIEKGVDPGRLQAKGYGKSRPIDKANNPAAWSKNRRVEFIILKRDEG